MRTTVEAGYIPAGSPLGAGTPRSSTIRTNTSQVDPERIYPTNFDAGVPTVSVTHNPDSGDAKDTAMGTAKFDYLLAAGSSDDWGFDFTTTSNSLDVYVGYLRRKTEAQGERRLIHTVRGVGYVAREQ